MNIFLTVVICCCALGVLTLALSGDAIVWWLPAYKRFKHSIDKLERTPVVRIKGVADPRGLTLRLAGRRRVPEIFVTGEPVAEAVAIDELFGAIFLKDESIDEVVALVKINAWAVFLVSLFGLLFIIANNPSAIAQVNDSSFWDKVPIMADLLLHNHLVLFAELVAILTSFIYLFHNVRLLRRLNRKLGG